MLFFNCHIYVCLLMFTKFLNVCFVVCRFWICEPCPDECELCLPVLGVYSFVSSTIYAHVPTYWHSTNISMGYLAEEKLTMAEYGKHINCYKYVPAFMLNISTMYQMLLINCYKYVPSLMLKICIKCCFSIVIYMYVC